MPEHDIGMQKGPDEYLLCFSLVSHPLSGQSLLSQRFLGILTTASSHIHSPSLLPTFPTNVLTTSRKDTSKNPLSSRPSATQEPKMVPMSMNFRLALLLRCVSSCTPHPTPSGTLQLIITMTACLYSSHDSKQTAGEEKHRSRKSGPISS